MTRQTVTIAVVGATGRLGSAVAREAGRRGHRVIAISRSGQAAHAGPGAEQRAVDVTQGDALARAVDGADVVFNGLNPPYPKWKRQALPLLDAVLSASRRSGALHLFPGNVYNFGTDLPPLLTEATARSADTRKGAIRIAMEKRMEAAAGADGPRSFVLRAGDFFGGPVPGAWFDLAFASKLRAGKVVHPGPMDRVHAWAYLPDLAHAFVDLAERHGTLPAFGSAGFAGHAVTGAQMHAALERAVGGRLRTAGLPWPLLRALGLVQPMMREVAEMAYLWQRPHAIDGAGLEALIGVSPTTPLDMAVRAAVADQSLAPTRAAPVRPMPAAARPS